MMEHDSEEAQAPALPVAAVLEISSESEAICQLKNWMGDNIFNMATVSFSDLYPWQEEALRLSLLSKTLLICVPTGGGKSMVYSLLPKAYELYMHIKTKTNIPKYQAMIIISPLIQLVNDQVRAARLLGISIHYIRTDERCEEQRKKIGKNIKDGECRALILFICCPETFTSALFFKIG